MTDANATTLSRRLEDATLVLLKTYCGNADNAAAARESLWRLICEAFAGSDLITAFKAAQYWADVGHMMPDEMLEAAAAKWVLAA